MTARDAVCVRRFSSSRPSSPCHSGPPTRSATIDDVGAGDSRDCPWIRSAVVAKPSTGAACAMSSALPAATRPLSSTSTSERTTSRRARTCATAPPSSPAPMMATSRMGWAIVMAMQSLRGKVALVTGGSRGIGLAIARALVAEGAKVVITGQSESHLSAARPKLEGAGPGAVETLQADVRRYADIEHAVNATVARFGGLDILINNAGIGVFKNVERDVAGRMDRGDRHQPDRRLQRVPRGAAAPAPPRRRLHHQHQQPRREESVRRRRGVLRVESRAERVQRSADAGSAVRQHPRELRDARFGRHRFLQRRRDERRRLEDRARRCRRRRRQPAAAQPAQPAEPRRAAAVRSHREK